MRGDEQRAAASPEVLLEPLERADVEVVRRLVEQQQVRVGDDEPGERARGSARRPTAPTAARTHSSRLESEPGQRLVDPLVERVAAEDVELVLEVGVAALLDAMLPLVSGRARPRSRRGAPRRADRRPQVGRRP